MYLKLCHQQRKHRCYNYDKHKLKFSQRPRQSGVREGRLPSWAGPSDETELEQE